MAGYRATCIDIEDYKGYGISKGPGSPFDILSNSGFAKLSSIQNKISLERGPRGEWGPGSARARKRLQFGALDARARGPRTPFKG